MPYGYGTTGVITSSAAGDITGSRQYTRLRGPVLVGAGSKADLASASVGASVQPPHIANVSTAPADLIMHAGQIFTTATATGYIYIPMTTVGFSSSTNANVGPVVTPAITKGAALIWDAGRKKLSVFSTDLNDWVSVTLTSS